MLSIQTYRNVQYLLAYDNKAYTITSTYHDGTLRLYIHTQLIQVQRKIPKGPPIIT